MNYGKKKMYGGKKMKAGGSKTASRMRKAMKGFKYKQGGSKPDYIDIDGDGNRTEPMKSAAKNKKNKKAKYGTRKKKQMGDNKTPICSSQCRSSRCNNRCNVSLCNKLHNRACSNLCRKMLQCSKKHLVQSLYSLTSKFSLVHLVEPQHVEVELDELKERLQDKKRELQEKRTEELRKQLDRREEQSARQCVSRIELNVRRCVKIDVHCVKRPEACLEKKEEQLVKS